MISHHPPRRRTRPLLLALALAAAACTQPPAEPAPSPETGLPSGPTQITIPFLSAGANGVLSRCAAGLANECDAARDMPEMNDGAFSYIHERCNAGEDRYCRLLEGLVDAELRDP
jgi:hypothetical protein